MVGAHTGIRIIGATHWSLAEINELITRSKAHGSWPAGYLERALPLHRVTPAYLRSNHCFEVFDAHDKLMAFFSIVVGSARVVLDNLWVTPEQIGKGIGRRACERVFQLAREQGWTELWVLPDLRDERPALFAFRSATRRWKLQPPSMSATVRLGDANYG